MTEYGTYEIEEGVAVLPLTSSQEGVLSPELREWVINSLRDAARDPAVSVVLLVGDGSGFSTGVNVTEFDDLRRPSVAELCLFVENCPKPVVASLHGQVLGAGLELALAAHYRVAHDDTEMAFPEVRMGLVPSGGGTQRGTRLLGAAQMLDMLIGGQPFRANDPRMLPMLDALTDRAPRQAGLSFCQRLAASGAGPRPTGARTEGIADYQSFRDSVDMLRAEHEDTEDPTIKEAIDCVEAAGLLSYRAALTFEQASFDTCLSSPGSFAMRQAYHAERGVERAARRFLGPWDVTRVVVLGRGSLAGQIVVALLLADFHVSWGVEEQDLQPDCVTRLNLILNAAVEEGMLDAEQKESVRARCHIGLTHEVADEGRLILIAARGQTNFDADPSVPRLICAPAKVDSVGLRFATPVPRAQLAEVIQGPRATKQQMEAAFRLCHRLGKLPVRLKSTGLAISDRIAAACHRAADALVDAGLSPYDVDAAMLDWGWTWPPFQLRDLIGLEATVGLVRADGAENWSAHLVEAGRRGRAFGQGFYDYDEEGVPKASRRVMDVVNARRAPDKSLSRQSVQLLMVGAMANEGARTLADGWARCPSDIDLVCLHTLNFPRRRGGPMTAADLEGLFRLTREMRGFDHPDKPFWTPHEVLYDLIKNGKTFSSMLG